MCFVEVEIYVIAKNKKKKITETNVNRIPNKIFDNE